MADWCDDEECDTHTKEDSLHQEPCRQSYEDEPKATQEYESSFGPPWIAPSLEAETVSMIGRVIRINGKLETVPVRGART